jgi:hypothetical protein
MLGQIKKSLAEWYRGKWIESGDNRHVILMGRTKRHWTSDAAHAAITFYLNHWKWLCSTVVAIAVAIYKIH